VVNLVRANRLDSAEALAARAAAADAHNSWLKIARGDVAIARGRPLEAMAWRRQVALEFPDEWHYWYLTADAALVAGYCPEAERSLARLRGLREDAQTLAELASRGRTLGCRT
jgi:predicted Zn-dependent protease